MKPRLSLISLFVLLFTLLAVQVVLAQEATPGPVAENAVTDDAVNAIAKQLYCPVCENIPLDVCPTQACTQWRGLIRQMIAEGKSETEIKDYFVLNYGDRVLATPPPRGLNWLVYVVPPVAILAGAFVLYRAMLAWRAAAAATESARPAVEAPPDEYVARLEEELRRR